MNQRIRMESSRETENLYNQKASLYQRVFIGFLNWGKQLSSFFRKSDYVRSNLKVLDAGCGTGIVTKTLYRIADENGYSGIQFYGFDLTENMLKIFRKWIDEVNARNVKIAEADVLDTNSLPIEWKDFDLIVSSTMLEYLPRDKVKDALVNLKNMLRPNGTIVVIITKRNLLTAWFAGKWWNANLYNKTEIKKAFMEAEFQKIDFRKFSFGWSSAITVIEGKK
jgi:ubiquinone/menaquinone biosynthesis C-methylase UbiE